ncbi:MAG TPA: sialidase family protein, partial [Candidatus Eisenbacteria bacterium]|nr:sialidase family protein [Candidatus Eisenbacteria bacterium]
MSRRLFASAMGMVLALALGGCAAREPGGWAALREVTPAFLADRDARHPWLATDRHGRVALTWVTNEGRGQDLWLALSPDSGLTFGTPVRVNPRPGSVTSYAECRPIAVFGPAGELMIAWSERRADSLLIADLAVRASGDGGHTLGPTVIVNDDASDGKPVFHGFPSLAVLPDGGWFAVWMDEREEVAKGTRGAAASLFYALSKDGGQTWSDNRPLTHQVCTRCRASAVADASGRVAVAYRTARDDLRDVALAVSPDGGVNFPVEAVISADGWVLSGCPVEPPSITIDPAGGGHYAWYTGAGAGGTWIVPWRADGGVAGLKRPLSDSLVSGHHP